MRIEYQIGIDSTFEFVVCSTELDDGTTLWDVAGGDGETRVVIHARSQRHAETIAAALNAGATSISAEVVS